MSDETKQIDGQRVKLEDLPPDVRADFLNALHWDAWRSVFGIDTKTVEQLPPPPAQQTDWKFWKRK